MRKLAVSMMLGLALVVFGASEAKAQACIDFDNFCDCLTVSGRADTVDGQAVTRLVGSWENQDCGGTTSPMQGFFRGGALSFTGELRGADGVNWNFTATTAPGRRVFDLDYWDGGLELKVQNESPYTVVGGACAAGCPALKDGLPASSQR